MQFVKIHLEWREFQCKKKKRARHQHTPQLFVRHRPPTLLWPSAANQISNPTKRNGSQRERGGGKKGLIPQTCMLLKMSPRRRDKSAKKGKGRMCTTTRSVCLHHKSRMAFHGERRVLRLWCHWWGFRKHEKSQSALAPRVIYYFFLFFFKAPNSCRTVMSAAVWRRPRSKRREAFITDYNNVSV